jgi:hypothetical protein
MKSDKQVRDFFYNELQPVIKVLEDFRYEKARKVRIYFILGCCIFLTAIILGIFVFPGLLLLIGLIALQFFGMAYQNLKKMISVLRSSFKFKVLEKLMQFLFEAFEYIPNQRIALSVLKKSKLFPNEINRADGEDFMEFRLGETIIMFCETQIYRSGNNRNPIFSGIFISAGFNKKFSTEIIIIPKKRRFKLKILFRKIFEGFEPIHLEQSEFTKVFNVYGTDQVESRYVLSTSLMERLLAYRNKVNDNIAYSFIANRVYCSIPNKINLFEPPLFETFLDFDCVQRDYEVLRLFTDIVEDLNLNLRIWTKN